MNAEISITERIAETIAQAQETEAERQRQAQLAAAQSEAKRQHELRLEWVPQMERLCTALPEWALTYVVDPDQEYSHYLGFDEGNGYAPISIVIPNLAPIAAYVYQDVVYYAAATPQRDEDGVPCLAQLTYYRNKYEIQNSETDFGVTVMKAKDAWDRYTTMAETWEAAQHAQHAQQAEDSKPAPIPLRQRLPLTDPAEYLVNILDGMPDLTVPESAPLWTALMIGMELREIRNTLDDIAAALTVPADDEMVVN